MRFIFLLIAVGALTTPSFSDELLRRYWGDALSPEQGKTRAVDFDPQLSALERLKFENSGINPFISGGGAHIRFGVFGLTRDGKVCVKIEKDSDQCDFIMTSHSVRFPLTSAGTKFPIYLNLEVR